MIVFFVQTEAAKAEISKPFPQEAELVEKSVRLALLDAKSNLNSGHSSPCEQYETDVTKSVRPSVLEALNAPCNNTAAEHTQVESQASRYSTDKGDVAFQRTAVLGLSI